MTLIKTDRTRVRTLACTLVLAFWMAMTGTVWAQDDRPFTIAVVDLDAVVARSPAGEALAGELEAFQSTARAEVERRQTEAMAIRQQVVDGASSLTEQRLAELQADYEARMVDIRRYADDQQREGQRRQQEGLREIERQLEPVFEQIQADYDYDVILNRVPGVVVMAGERADITAEVIRRLQQR